MRFSLLPKIAVVYAAYDFHCFGGRVHCSTRVLTELCKGRFYWCIQDFVLVGQYWWKRLNSLQWRTSLICHLKPDCHGYCRQSSRALPFIPLQTNFSSCHSLGLLEFAPISIMVVLKSGIYCRVFTALSKGSGPELTGVPVSYSSINTGVEGMRLVARNVSATEYGSDPHTNRSVPSSARHSPQRVRAIQVCPIQTCRRYEYVQMEEKHVGQKKKFLILLWRTMQRSGVHAWYVMNRPHNGLNRSALFQGCIAICKGS